jgi:hypothetical protein
MSEFKNYIRIVLWSLFGGEWSLVGYHLDGLWVAFYRMVSQIPIRCRFLRGAVRLQCQECHRPFGANEIAGTFLTQQGDKIVGTCGYCMNPDPEPNEDTPILVPSHERMTALRRIRLGSNPT